ncbi:uncharacterized protein GIQ15_04154 [Arthroderma uncinatum]|uniref:uncharacterized protein n=1 Tax=Arthroderma uncinatum TaxID=74035 RepID=UPI00144A98B2|nr:uncharacterized protein GIQ15_04154 [Arthroderma uncinatum]KAF3481395.1 hypothetical protein GIQ15_04154 [Arthroderma uncinatum]
MPHPSNTAPTGRDTANNGGSAPSSVDNNGVVNGGQLQQFANSFSSADCWTTYSSGTNKMEHINAVIDDIKRKFGQ